MSGGPYGRGKAPERACMKIADWPAPDRALWHSALAPTDPFVLEGGARAQHAVISNSKVERGYGRWLTWLSLTSLTLSDAPHQRITSCHVKAYVAHLHDLGNASQTILARLQELAEMAKVLEPMADWGFIKSTASRVRSGGKPARDKRVNLAMTDDLVSLGLTLMGEASKQRTARLSAIAGRDGLLIGFLALRPLRRKNLAGLSLGRTLVPSGDGWAIRIAAADTKTKTPIEAPWPEVLVAPLEQYLAVHRPVLMSCRSRWAAPVGEALWVSADGSPMTEMAIYDRIRQHTRERLGKHMNPHLFRDAAATTLAIQDPGHVRLAAAILGHRSFATTERHYQQAQTIDAHRQFVDSMQCLRHRLWLGSMASQSSKRED